MRNAFLVFGIFGFLLTGCSGSTSGGVGTDTSGFYRGTMSWSGYNTCGRQVPGRGSVEIVISSDGSLKFEPIGLRWGQNYGWTSFLNAVSGSKISGSHTSNISGYKYRIDGRINDGGATISGTGSIEGSYGSCYEKYSGSFAATRVG
ncbi:hypothetical protein ACMAY5_08665 [Arenicellales bacterium nBUS_48]